MLTEIQLHSRPIYLDNHSTTPVDPRVLEVMLPYFCEHFGNAASINHSFGTEAGEAVERARSDVASLLGADSKEIIFTSGATESNNLALKGVMRAAPAGSHLIVNAAEHKAILDPAKSLEREGFQVTVLPVDQHGRVAPESVAAAIRPETALASVMWANNEVGTLNPIAEIGRICRERGVLFHTDATQSVGKVPIDLAESPIDLLSLSAHKMYGPKGIGALYVRRGSRRIRIEPLFDGGGHERRLRSGTLPVPNIVGLGAACRLSADALDEESGLINALRDRLWSTLSEQIEGVALNGHPELRLAGNLNVSFEGVNSEALMMKLKDVLAVSSGSACTTAEPQPSHVLTAMGIAPNLIESTIRFGLGRFTRSEEIDEVCREISQAVAHLRRFSH